MEVYGIRLLTGHRISEEVFNELADLAPNYSKNILEKLFNSPLGGFSPGVLSYSAGTSNLLLEIAGNNIRVSNGIVIFPDGLLVDLPGLLSIQVPDDSKYIYLVYQLVDDESYVSHDFKGVIDYPLKKVKLSLDFVPSSGGGPQPIAGATNRIRLGYYDSLTHNVSYHGRQYAIITSGLLWPGDNDSNINSSLDLTPSVEPGASLWQFLACKGSGERKVNNPFGLTFDDIQGELYSEIQSILLFNGVVANPKGINGDVPLRLTVDANNTYQINLNVNQDGSYYGISDSEQEGIILVNGHWFKHVDKYFWIPIIFLVLAIGLLVYNTITTGEFVKRDIDLSGGKLISLTSNKSYGDIERIVGKYTNDYNIRSMAGKKLYIIEIPENIDDKTIINDISPDSYSVRVVGPIVSDIFWRQAKVAITISFILMAIVVFLIFKSIVPSGAVILSAISDVIITVAVLSIMNVGISISIIGALLMLIGYSVDTDILLTTKAMKSTKNIEERIFKAFKTGIMTSGTSLTALIVMYIFSSSLVIKEIALTLSIGLFVDIMNTWVLNAGIIKMWVQKKEVI